MALKTGAVVRWGLGHGAAGGRRSSARGQQLSSRAVRLWGEWRGKQAADSRQQAAGSRQQAAGGQADTDNAMGQAAVTGVAAIGLLVTTIMPKLVGGGDCICSGDHKSKSDAFVTQATCPGVNVSTIPDLVGRLPTSLVCGVGGKPALLERLSTRRQPASASRASDCACSETVSLKRRCTIFSSC